MTASIRDVVLAGVNDERDRQDAIWGENRKMPHTLWFTILGEEVGEVANAILEGKHKGLYDELIQVAAVAVAFAEALLPEDGVPAEPVKTCPTLSPAQVTPCVGQVDVQASVPQVIANPRRSLL